MQIIIMFVCMRTVTQSCLTLCNHIDCGLPSPVSMVFSRQDYWSGLPCPSPGNGIETASPEWKANSLPLSHMGSPIIIMFIILLLQGIYLVARITWEQGYII